MKPISFPNGNKNWRVMPPARYTAGKRKTFYFVTKDEAETFCKNVKRYGAAAIESSAPVLTKTQEDRFSVAVNHAAELVGGDVTKVYEAIRHYQKTRLNVKPATVREAVEAFQAWRQAQAAGGKLSKSTVDADRWRLLKLINAFDVVQLVELTPVVLREFFDGITGDPRSVYKSVRAFFGWAIERGYLGENPMATVKPVGEYGINNEYYSPETFRRMLRIAAGLDPVKAGGAPTQAFRDLLPWFILSGFLGLRSCEAYRLNRTAEAIRWTDLHFEAEPVGFVEVREEVAKATARATDLRHIETAHYLEAAKAWLDYLGAPGQEGPFIVIWTKRHMQELKRRFTKATGLKFSENGFRNSFATYALTFNGLQGVGKLALEMGNSEQICKRHYVKTIAPGSGQAWFNLRPFEVVPAAATA